MWLFDWAFPSWYRINLEERLEGNVEPFVQAFERFLPHTGLAMPEVPTLLPGEAGPMSQFPNGRDAMLLQ
ncbi:MAG: hypothetical protein M3361_07660 [Candidatus Tectomicrobia bacterium]|nr:hypothetical protein [Candidatus Tectomicrobia bacterium]